MHCGLSSRLKEDALGPYYPKESDNSYVTEVYTRRNHGTSCRDPAPLQDEGCIS